MKSPLIAAILRRAGLKTGVAAAVAVALLVGGPAASAQPRPAEHEEPAVETFSPTQREQLMPAQRGGGVSLAQASSMAQSRYMGRVVRAETVQMGDRRVHEIRILSEDGRVHIVRIDAQTGAFL